ncbi:pentatricopeptide repeat-containing protein At3g60050-like [Trifolium pratense]|uniref:pentatricopeptide repeat-containing protein At3g60050-like n=1 Tax=Trifolium pratense TaxID=57577 RepID=UPI001E693F17|nr:pentatricopeptide repeat-containing protein At3g60050-like [Trifolium pratense]XP_045814342.1 pentatricopeptide repeat-containing protein At3g60050-like [Trifolium pratense]XP_045814343.1 pentatricopeptide repeat-containing protein At3g60050-like [Trifolium pratense]XP_045814344.1 pentatricopeptide repeat-containing protein At3g60050-like [Trifolium pratense]
MNSITLLGHRMVHKIYQCLNITRKLCDQPFHVVDDEVVRNGFELVEEPLKKMFLGSFENVDLNNNEENGFGYNQRRFLGRDGLLGNVGRIDFERENGDLNDEDNSFGCGQRRFSVRDCLLRNVRINVERILEVLRKDELDFDFKLALDELNIRPTWILVREVLYAVLREVNCDNKSSIARLAYKFFVWCDQKKGYCHTVNSYNLIMQIFAKCEDFKAMWRLVDVMIEKGFPATARTFNILICASGEAGFAMNLVVRFIKSRSFNFRSSIHSYNAILHCLLVLNRYTLIEWVYGQMLSEEDFSSDVLTYNILMLAKYRLGKMNQFHTLLYEMERRGLSPDFHTYNILLHVLGRGDKPLASVDLLNRMRETGIEPTVLHFTTLIDGLSRSGNMDACKYFFDEMVRIGCMPDVVAYTVMITGYVVACEFEKAQEMFDEMIYRGQIPNVFTYNSMIHGFCMAGKFDEACSMLKEMETKGCSPNFVVYRTLVSNLRNAGKLSRARKVLRQMMEKGRNVHHLPKLRAKRYRK